MRATRTHDLLKTGGLKPPQNWYVTISTNNKNAEIGYYLVRWPSDSCTLHNSIKIGKYVIKDGWLVFDSVYLNPLDNLKQWYTLYKTKTKYKELSG